MLVVSYYGLEIDQRLDPTASIGVGIAPLQFGRDVIKIGRGLGQRHAGLEPSQNGEALMIAAVKNVFIGP